MKISNLILVGLGYCISELVDNDIEDVIDEPIQKFIPQAPLLNWKTVTINDFAFEIMVIALLVLYLVVYYKGKSQNEQIARKWVQANSSSFEKEFAEIGSKGKKLIYDGPKDYIFYATGREHVQFLYGFLTLKPRHDLIGQLFEYLFGPVSYDKVTMEVTMNPSETDSIVFGILPKSSASKMTKERWDLDQFAKSRDVAGFPKSDYVLLTENHEVTGPLVQLESFKKALWNSLGLDQNGKGTQFSHPILEQVVYSDITSTKPEKIEDLYTPKVLRFVFRIPDNVGSSEYKELCGTMNRMVMDTIDALAIHARLSQEGKQRSVKLREAAISFILKQREEERKKELTDKKIAERKKQLEDIVNLPPDQQRKAEEKLKKKEMKKSMQKKMKRV